MRQKEKSCAHCGETFTPERRNGMYCSNTCRQYSYLNRKNGETNVLPKKRVPIEYDNTIPALVIEEDEELESLHVNSPSTPNQYPSVNYQFKEKNKTSNSINTVKSIDWNYSGSINNSNQNETILNNNQMKEEQINQQQNVNELPIPVVEFNNFKFELIEKPDVKALNQLTNSLFAKTYVDVLEEDRHDMNYSLKQFWIYCKTNKTTKAIVDKFCQTIKPYYVALRAMDQKPVTINALANLYKEMERAGNTCLPSGDCPLDFPAINFYERAIENSLKQLLLEMERKSQSVVFMKFSDKSKAFHENMLKLIGYFTPNTPDNWLLP